MRNIFPGQKMDAFHVLRADQLQLEMCNPSDRLTKYVKTKNPSIVCALYLRMSVFYTCINVKVRSDVVNLNKPNRCVEVYVSI